ncbi:MAG TPA: VOC family protein [Polyangiales bacterium]|nr:VOC family protein [Polyangiales bacterium]
MSDAMKLGYLVFESARAPQWREFCARMLGLTQTCENSDGSVGYRLDDAVQRLIVAPSRRDDLQAVGLECTSPAALAAIAQRVEASGARVEAGTPQLQAARRVERLVRFCDPAGNVIELFTGPAHASDPFHSEHFPSGFEVGELGIGHAALVCQDISAAEHFYRDVLGFGVSERLSTNIGGYAVQGVFLHCNRRHHSLALFNLPLRRRLHHFMLQARDFHAVGRAFERAENLDVPLHLSLGQHGDPDGTFSFYGVTPSGFEFEIGAGGREIDPATFREVHSQTPSAWGHKPSLRLKLQTLKELLRVRAESAFSARAAVRRA